MIEKTTFVQLFATALTFEISNSNNVYVITFITAKLLVYPTYHTPLHPPPTFAPHRLHIAAGYRELHKACHVTKISQSIV